jgi:thiol-disulfide isomerase/thioredoxin
VGRPAGIAALVLVAAAATILGYFMGRDRQEAEPGQPPAAEARVPETRPLFSLQDTQGEPRSIAEWDGRALLINFWATWCAPCRREIPLLNELRADYADRGFEVIGVAVDFRDDVLEYMKTTPIDYPVLIGEQDGLEVAQAFGMQTLGFPATVFTDREGRIVTIHVGELHADQAAVILGAVESLMAGSLGLEAARDRIRSQLAELRQDPA